jgi:hypothetical protein
MSLQSALLLETPSYLAALLVTSSAVLVVPSESRAVPLRALAQPMPEEL